MAKRKHVVEKKKESPKTKVELPPVIRSLDEPVSKKVKWINRERVLIFAGRGITARDRHLMNDFKSLMPHSKSETKMDQKDRLFVINEICEMKNCNKCIFFENRKRKDLYVWIANVPNGPSVKFLVQNVHTMMELRMIGNCLKGSRPLLSFDKAFESKVHLQLLKELFIQVFSTPHHHPKSQPFIDHIFSFTYLDNRIWFRNYQISEEDGSILEIGPRMVLNPIRIFQGSFQGQVIYENPKYISPNLHRHLLKKAASVKYIKRIENKLALDDRKPETSYSLDSTNQVFKT